MNETLAQLLAWTVLNSQYPAPPQPPELVFEPAPAFTARACPGQPECRARGYYEDGSRRIVIHDQFRHLSTLQQRSLLVHELMHFLQDESRRFDGDKTCEMWLAREGEAFRIQVLYLVRHARERKRGYRVPRLSRRQCESAVHGGPNL